MDFDGFDQTQAIALDDYSDDTDDLGDPDDKKPAGYLKVFYQKSFNETSFPVFEGDNFIGRHESNEICIPLKALSKKHACIEIQGDSHLIYDLESRNKTRRGKLFLKPSVRYELQDPDSLLFGDVRCQYTRAEIQNKPRELVADSDDNGSDTGSESMLLDTQNGGEKTEAIKEPHFGSSSSCDIIQPTQACKVAESKKMVILETPQREGATLVFAESSDENVPAESVKAVADSSISPGSIAETPGSKPLAESTVINESDIEESGRTRRSELDASALAMAPTQPYGDLAELETQAYPANTDSDKDDDDDDRGRSLFDAPTQAFGVPDSEDEMEHDKGPNRNKRISMEPTLILNVSTDDETSPVKRPARPKPYPQDIAEQATLAYDDDDASKHPEGNTDDDGEPSTLGYADLATQAYCADTDDQSDDEEADSKTRSKTTSAKVCPRRGASNDDDAPMLSFPDLATQAYCADTDDHSDEDEFGRPSRKTAPTLDPTLKYDMQPGSPGTRPDKSEVDTLAYCAETDSDVNERTGRGAEPTMKYDMGVTLEPTLAYTEEDEGEQGVEGDEEGSKGRAGVDIALEPTLAYTTEEDDEEMDISAIAIAETQAYITTDSDLDEEPTKPKIDGPTTGRKPIKHTNTEAPTLTCDDDQHELISRQTKGRVGDEPSSEGTGAHCDDATLAFNNDDDDEAEAMDTEMSMDEGEDRMMGHAEMVTQPACGMEESDPACQPEAPTLQFNTTEDEDDTTAATQAYGKDNEDDETPDILGKPSTSSSYQLMPPAKQQRTDPLGGMGDRKLGSSRTEMKRGGKEDRAEEMDDFVMATQVYGADEEGSETQVPDSQEGAGEEECPLAGISRISSMLRKVPVRSAMASPEKKPQRARRVAFKEQTPPEEAVPEEEKLPSRKSARGRKVPVRFQQETPTTTVTETDAKPTRRRSKDLRYAQEKEATVKAKSKGNQDVVEGQVRPVDGDSEEDTLELKEGGDMVWKSVGGFELPEVNNNDEIGIKGKPPTRRTSRRQGSYKKAVEGHESDDTESMSSTSSMQVEVGDLAAVKVQVTVCDGKQSGDALKPRRGRRSNTTKEGTLKDEGTTSRKAGKLASEVGKPLHEKTTPSGRRQSRRSIVKESEGAEAVQATKPRPGRGNKSDHVPEAEPKSKEEVSRSSRSKKSAPERTATVGETKEAPPPPRKGRKPKSTASPQTKGPKQSSITDFAIMEDKGKIQSKPEESSAKSGSKICEQTDSLESTESPSLLSPEARPSKTLARSGQSEPRASETEAKPRGRQAAKQDSFTAPEQVKRAGRPRRGAKEDKGQRSTEPVLETVTPEKAETISQGRGKKKGKNSSVLETPEKEERPSTVSTSSRRGKRATPTQTTPSPSPAKKRKEPESPETDAASPSLRRRPSESKPKVMFTGVVNKAWEKIVTSLGGELVESVFDCTHLVTDKVRRTVKFLCCLSRGALIISPKWLDQCQLNKTFVDPSPYLLQDKASEKQYGFSHATSHQRALQGGVLAKLSIFVTANVKPEPAQMKEVVQSAGGKFLSSMPKKPDSSTIVISCDADEARCQPALKAGLQVVSAEFILTGILRQESRPDLYQLFMPSSTTSEPGRKLKVNNNPSSGKRRR